VFENYSSLGFAVQLVVTALISAFPLLLPCFEAVVATLKSFPLEFDIDVEVFASKNVILIMFSSKAINGLFYVTHHIRPTIIRFSHLVFTA